MEINEYLCKLIQTARELENFDYFKGKTKLGKTEFRLVREILIERSKGEGIISSELARRLGITRSAVSQIVTKLEKADIVVRTASDTDKKIAYIKLTPSAAQEIESQCADANNFMQRVIMQFGEERMKLYLKESEELFRVISEAKKEINGN